MEEITAKICCWEFLCIVSPEICQNLTDGQVEGANLLSDLTPSSFLERTVLCSFSSFFQKLRVIQKQQGKCGKQCDF